ncbi:hypothetical protein JW948_05960 [bacterium]|nr:hypothetical protein [bacterium]
MRKIWLPIAVLLFIRFDMPAVPFQGGHGLIYVHSADILKPGYLDVSGGTRYFGKIANFGGQEKAYTLWVVKGYTSINYGLNDHVELALCPVLYQDTNKGSDGINKESVNFPDDIFLGVKFGSFQKLESPYVYGGRMMLRIPTADKHNIIYEEYSAGGLEILLSGMLSYYSNVQYPDAGWSLHANLGYLNHNDVGRELTKNPDDPSPNSMSSELLFGAGALFPAGQFDFSVEINANTFLSRPPVTAYSREYASYLTGGVYYRHNSWLQIQMGMDIRLISDRDLSEYSDAGTTSLSKPPTGDFPNYPSWRGILGFKVALLPKALRTSDEDELRRKTRDRRNILERMIDEQKDTEDAEEELSRIKSERQRVEQELERLRKLLEQEKKKDN